MSYFWIEESYFLKCSIYDTVALQINDDVLLIWILSKGYGSLFSIQKYVYYVHGTMLSTVRDKESVQFLSPRSSGQLGKI